MSTAKRHHTVPQFYLRGFARDEQITTVRLPGDVRFPQAVRKAASHNRFYAVEGHKDGEDVFEKSMSRIEGEAAGIFNLIGAGSWPLDSEARMTLALFIALQAVRGPEQRRNMEFIAAQTARLEIGYGGRDSVKGWVKRKTGLDINDDLVEEVWQQATTLKGPPIKVDAIDHIEQIGVMSEAILPYLAGRPWTLYRFNRRSLITSDTPVALIEREDATPWEGIGYLNAWGLTYPLTRKLGLLMTEPLIDRVPVQDVWAGGQDSIEIGSTCIEKFFNWSTATSASEALFHHPDDASFVPAVLPGPNLHTIRMPGGPPNLPDDRTPPSTVEPS